MTPPCHTISDDLPHIAYSSLRDRSPIRPCIVHLVEGFSLIGGPPVLVRQIIYGPLKEKYNFHVISYAIRGFSPKSLFTIRRLLCELRPDIVHVHGLKPDGFHAVLAAKLAGVPKIVTVIHSSTELSVSEYASLLAKLKRWLVCHIMETATLFFSDAIYTVCNHIRNNRRIIRWSGHRLKETIYNCMQIPMITKTRSEIRKEFGFCNDDFLLIFIGRVCKNKGLLVLADAMDKIIAQTTQKSLKLVIVGSGSGDEYETIKERFRELNDRKKVFFIGVQKDVFNLNKMADIFVLPSVFKENFSFSLLEATAAGAPVIATNHGGNPELIINEKTGLLVPPADPQAFADAVLRLIGNEEMRAKLAIAGRERTKTVFSVENMLEKTHCLYQELLPKDKRSQLPRHVPPDSPSDISHF
ncbi:MAG: glycosyltransferase [Lentisphaeria bacterium]|jgi:glycosyltransferase involved in cell wall biosynthesis